MDKEISQVFSVSEIIPSAGQGIIALQCRKHDAKIISILRKVNHEETFQRAQAERNILKVLEGDCETAVGAHAIIKDDQIILEAELFSLDGKKNFYEKKKLKSKVPIVVKVSPDIDDREISKVSEVILNNYIEAIIISNTSDSTRDNLSDIQGHQKGGLSGKPIEEKSTDLINKFYRILGDRIKIIGVGGVDSGISAYKKFLAGASYIQLYTGMVYRGPNIVNLIKKELKELLIKDGVKNFSEIIGKKTSS